MPTSFRTKPKKENSNRVEMNDQNAKLPSERNHQKLQSSYNPWIQRSDQVTVQLITSLPQLPCPSAQLSTLSGNHPAAKTLSPPLPPSSPCSAGLPTLASGENKHPISESAYCTHPRASSHIPLHPSSELPCVPARRSGDRFVQFARSAVVCGCT